MTKASTPAIAWMREKMRRVGMTVSLIGCKVGSGCELYSMQSNYIASYIS